MTDVLCLESISKRFGGVQALDDVSLRIQPAEVHALLGHNGSGKSTLIKILSGYHSPDHGGRCWIVGEPVSLPINSQAARARGLAFVHQQPGVLPTLTVTENLIMSRLAVQGFQHIGWRSEAQRARTILSHWGLDFDPRQPVSSLRPVEVAMLSIVRAVDSIPGISEQMGGLAARSQHAGAASGLLVLDEATAALTAHEVAEVFDVVPRVTAAGVAVMFVSHDIDEVMRIADRITVLRDGHVAATVDAKDVSRDEIVAMIVGEAGRAINAVEREAERLDTPERIKPAVLTIDDYQSSSDAPPISISVRQGEILGLTGLVGSPARDLPYLVYGAAPWIDKPVGTVRIAKREFRLDKLSPPDALRAGLVLVPGARLREAGVASFTVFENLSVVLYRRFFRNLFIHFNEMREHTSGLLTRFKVLPPDPTMKFANLSGGNQQKVVVAKWLQGVPAVVLLVDPTQGVDVGARAEIWATVVKLAQSGCGVICASTDSEELATICHRVLVLRQEGGIYAEAAGAELDKDRITELCLRSSEPAVRTEG